MNDTLQQLRELAIQPHSVVRIASVAALFSSCTHQDWFPVALDYAREHKLLREEDCVRLRLQHDAALAHQSWINPTDGTEMIWIPPGAYRSGSLYWDGNPKSLRGWARLTLQGFSMARYPVTNAQYAHFIQETGYRSPLKVRWDRASIATLEAQGSDYPKTTSYLKHWENGHFPPEKADHPVVYVSWFDAQMYSRWAGLVLPTCQMWEKAARGTDGRKFPWGNQLINTAKPLLAHINRTETCAVYDYASTRSAYGCQQMLGNITEICELMNPTHQENESMPWVRPPLSFLENYRRYTYGCGSNYGGYVDVRSRMPHPEEFKSHQKIRLNTARHLPWCGFRLAYVPNMLDPQASTTIDFEGFEAHVQKSLSERTNDREATNEYDWESDEYTLHQFAPGVPASVPESSYYDNDLDSDSHPEDSDDIPF